MTQVKQRLPKRNVTSNVHEFTSESEDFCDDLSDDLASSDTGLPTANFEKGETGPLVSQQHNADRRPNTPYHAAIADIRRNALPSDMIFRPEAT